MVTSTPTRWLTTSACPRSAGARSDGHWPGGHRGQRAVGGPQPAASQRARRRGPGVPAVNRVAVRAVILQAGQRSVPRSAAPGAAPRRPPREAPRANAASRICASPDAPTHRSYATPACHSTRPRPGETTPPPPLRFQPRRGRKEVRSRATASAPASAYVMAAVLIANPNRTTDNGWCGTARAGTRSDLGRAGGARSGESQGAGYGRARPESRDDVGELVTHGSLPM